MICLGLCEYRPYLLQSILGLDANRVMMTLNPLLWPVFKLGWCFMINFPGINVLNPLPNSESESRLGKVKGDASTVHHGQSLSKLKPVYQERRRQKDRRQSNGAWPIDSREGRERRKLIKCKQQSSVDVTV